MDSAIAAENVTGSLFLEEVYVLVERTGNVHVVAHVHYVFAGGSFREGAKVFVIATILFIFMIMDGVAVWIVVVLEILDSFPDFKAFGGLVLLNYDFDFVGVFS